MKQLYSVKIVIDEYEWKCVKIRAIDAKHAKAKVLMIEHCNNEITHARRNGGTVKLTARRICEA
ncbi:MAG: hypothetical protein J6J78_08975 [Clostridia bacterium]|nr:hypothetical protein [Clostridia bacterium]